MNKLMNVYKYIEFFNNYLNEFKINCTCSIFLCQAGKWSTKSYNSRSKVLQNWSAFLFTRSEALGSAQKSAKCAFAVSKNDLTILLHPYLKKKPFQPYLQTFFLVTLQIQTHSYYSYPWLRWHFYRQYLL